MMKQTSFVVIFFVLLSIFLGLHSVNAQQVATKNKFDKLVIDAGHGGAKPGAVGRKAKEKDITLAVSLKLGKMITEHLKDVEV